MLDALAAQLRAVEPGATVTFEALDPDRAAGLFDGELVEVDGVRCRARGYAGWVDVAAALGCVLTTPVVAAPGFVRLGLRKLDPEASWHDRAAPSGDPEKYGVDSGFARVCKFDEASLLVAARDAVRFLGLPPAARVLSVGVNQGDELGVLAAMHGDAAARFVGLDHSASAIERARARFPGPRFTFIEADLNHAAALDLGRFDLVVAINTLHSPTLDGQGLFRRLVGQHLTPTGGVLLGFPNCRYLDGATTYGAKVKGYSHSEQSVLFKDVGYYKRYLHQHRFVVTVTGKHTVLVTGRRLRAR